MSQPSNPNTDSLNADGRGEGLSAYNSLNRGDATTSESSLGEEGLTTSRVNHAAMDDTGTDADETVEHGGAEAHNASELDYDRDTREDAGNGAGSDAGRPPLRNGDTGYSG